jgi:hypothetical protein
MDGSARDLEQMLQLRDNCGMYCEILDQFAPAVVQLKTWNNDDNMEAHCGTNDLHVFEKHVLSISDEAFLLLVLINSAERWMAELIRAKKMVCYVSVCCHGLLLIRTPNLSTKQTENTWTALDEANMPVSVCLNLIY